MSTVLLGALMWLLFQLGGQAGWTFAFCLLYGTTLPLLPLLIHPTLTTASLCCRRDDLGDGPRGSGGSS